MSKKSGGKKAPRSNVSTAAKTSEKKKRKAKVRRAGVKKDEKYNKYRLIGNSQLKNLFYHIGKIVPKKAQEAKKNGLTVGQLNTYWQNKKNLASLFNRDIFGKNKTKVTINDLNADALDNFLNW